MLATRLPPGPPGRFLTGHLGELRTNLLGLYTRCAREYGDVALLRFGLRPVWVLSHPDLVEQVLTSRHFTKHYALRMNRLLLGNGLLSSDGDFWLRQRRLMQPAFLRDRVTSYAGVMFEYSERWARSWRDDEKRNIHADMRQLTMEIAGKTLFGADAYGRGPAVAQALTDVMDAFVGRLFSVLRLPESVPTPANIRAWRAIRRLDAILYGLIESRRADGSQADLLSILLHARDEQDGTGMTDKQLRDEAMTLFLAGHETTALALTYTLYLLAGHPDIQEQMRTELRDVLGDRPATAADVPLLGFTERVILESMRLYPPAYVLGRQAAEPCELGGYVLPAGGTVLMPQWVIHRDPRFYDEPDRFQPDRWADDLQKRLPRFAYFPFGGGPRVCIGNAFAMMEMVLVLASICRRWSFTRASTEPLRFKPRMTLAPLGPVELVFSLV
jgi:cytochrome P450